MVKPSARTFRIIGYSRVSTMEQASEGMSLDAQESRIRAWCESQGAELVEIVRDEGVSGTKLLAERSGGRRDDVARVRGRGNRPR